ncbi:hypothetical protein DCAR_0520750 [Daucus carota subsp. sativus]|uniref:Uncharacterized protein n=1 Tax=Daucus carota subsp. sativus TaxID=79200 RepID=A0A164YRK1_DAUCS|nr:PREDICTED: uncharacterized protein LOC108220168 [Daucus carota subsp. sativus]WOH01368.1 hypothetical protein DCAR_0520750 [Daucus carota subsp. sativus]
MVASQYSSQASNRQRIKQPASVPFLWEVRPGLPKKDWKPNPSVTPVDPIALPPVKLIASVPFKWEEMPGKPLPYSLREKPKAAPLLLLPPPPSMPADFQSPARTVYSQNYCDNSDDEMYDSYLDAWGFEFDEESISSAPSLVANRLIPTLALTNAVPVEENVPMDTNSGQLQAPGSPAYESDSSTSSYASYATGNTSLVGAPFLERLFPLLTPKVSFLGKHGCNKGIDSTPQAVPGKDVDVESERSLAVKRPSTLGELILMSRRRSYQRKANLMREQDLSMEFMKKSMLGCCRVGSGNKIKGLQEKWKQQLQLKLS